MSHDAAPPPPDQPPAQPYAQPFAPDPFVSGQPYAPTEAFAPAPVAAGESPAVPTTSAALISIFLVGGALAVLLGVYGRLHSPTGVSINIAGFSGPLEVKVWLASLAFTLALVQLVSALAMWGKLPFAAPSWIGGLHRWSGRVAFLAAVPVAVHCLYAVGFQSYDTRVVVHSLTGCLFFGAFTVKMLGLSRHGMPGWFLPVLGGTVFTGLTVLWLTSSLWFFTTVGVRF